MSKSVWLTAKIQLCWWHLRKAIRERLAKSKLSTTPYRPARANQEFPFINIAFRPAGTPDTREFEGGVLLEPDKVPTDDKTVPSLSIHIPNPSQLCPSRIAKFSNVDSADDGVNTIKNTLTIKIKIPKKGPDEQLESVHSRVFCPPHLCESVIGLIEHHFCAHPLIPGYSYPSAVGICQWAVKQMYTFCKESDLCEVWAYLWENWYRRGRWELWARAIAPMEIPRLKTTMVLESHWRRIKVDYLYHFSKPRIDLLAWILVTKLAPSYNKKLDHLLHDTGHFRELSSWRKSFKSEWR
ncbi:uncharacterized protein EDB91DRAFT_1049969 [Suillus paluster]|uniref:uncharacterized protein n=1 Tax=Suillus paluster TaxID=48578 RepID=UPI001B85EF67|nr:uncharacterized protein EDB91DRAFT_1049969 [Suillus paluster]KAG1745455.1 hypothetical protein EDB91DRAFT_1049969 [Suillus paluster]